MCCTTRCHHARHALNKVDYALAHAQRKALASRRVGRLHMIAVDGVDCVRIPCAMTACPCAVFLYCQPVRSRLEGRRDLCRLKPRHITLELIHVAHSKPRALSLRDRDGKEVTAAKREAAEQARLQCHPSTRELIRGELPRAFPLSATLRHVLTCCFIAVARKRSRLGHSECLVCPTAHCRQLRVSSSASPLARLVLFRESIPHADLVSLVILN